MTLQKFLEDAGFECRNYIGRDTIEGCLAIDLEREQNIGDFISEIISAIMDELGSCGEFENDEMDDFCELLYMLRSWFTSMRIDSTGLNIVIYFPGIKAK